MNWYEEQLSRVINLMQHPVIITEHTVITVWSIIVIVSLLSLLGLATVKLGNAIKSMLQGKTALPERTLRIFTRFAQIAIIYFGGTVILDVSDLDISATQVFELTSSIFKLPLVPVGKQPITLWMITFVAVLGYTLLYFTGKLQRWLAQTLNKRPSLDYGTAQSVSSIFRYSILAIGFVIILQAAGIDLSTVTVIAGALGLGVGLGLQNIVSNLVSGLVVMFERPVKVGDRIEVGGVHGDVVKLSLRAATIRTNDNIEIIVPNNEFINGNVINWSHSSKDVRVNIPVGVSYSADPEKVKTCLLNSARECEGVINSPKPDVIFEGFGDSSLNFELRVYTRTHANKPRVLKSMLNYSIFKELRKEDIEIPFPQRDLHIRSSIFQNQPDREESISSNSSVEGNGDKSLEAAINAKY